MIETVFTRLDVFGREIIISWDLKAEALIKLKEVYLLIFSMKIWRISLPIFIVVLQAVISFSASLI